MLLDFFQYDFLERALISGILLSLVAPLIGTFLVARRYSLLSDTLAHVSLLGVALGMLLGWSPLAVSLVVVAVSAIGIERLRAAGRVFGESVLAVFLSGSLAFAVVIMSFVRGSGTNISSYLFGSLSTVTVSDVWLIALFSILVAVAVFVSYRALFLVTLDEELAQVSGASVKRINMAFLFLVAISVALLSRVVGALLVGALMVIPTLGAFQWRRSFAHTLVIAEILSFFSVVSGIVVSYVFSTPTGGTIVLSALSIFILSVLVSSRRSGVVFS